jgi:bifunctional DNA-binding transcriptional regulator/antitoxin component of YhaV-PrlF toxin-antitoxin module
MSGFKNTFPDDTVAYGTVPISQQGQVTIPKDAREALGFDRGKPLYVFGSPSLGQAWILVTNRSGKEIAEHLAGDETSIPPTDNEESG